MSPEQLAALREEILAGCPADMRARRDTQEIADHLNRPEANRRRLRSSATHIGKGTIVAVLGVTEQGALVANGFLDAIENTSTFRHMREVIARGDLDLTQPLAQTMIQAMVPALLTQPQADALKALGYEPDPVAEFDVRRACWSDSGEWMV